MHPSQFELLARSCEAFSYNRAEKIFKVGARTVELAEAAANPYQTLSGEFMNWQEGQARPQVVAERMVVVENSPVVIGSFSTVVTTPMFNQRPKLPEALNETRGVIKEAYLAAGGPKTPPEADSGTGFMSFAAGLTPNNHVLLQTFGNCACFGPNPEGMHAGSEEWTDGYVEYAFHNTDETFQVISVLAGIGHLAALSSRQG